MNLDSRPLLLTGADGFLASRLLPHLARSRTVIGLRRAELDITEAPAVERVLEALHPAVVIHAAAVSDTGACQREPERTRAVNVEGPLHLARACARLGARLVFLSSDQVFNGNPEPGPYGEDIEPVPDTAYGRQKREAEQGVLALAPEALVLRLTWLFDLPQRRLKTNANLAWNVVQAALHNRPLVLPTREFRGLTYVQDLVERFPALLELPGGIVHAGGSSELSTYEAGRVVLEALGIAERAELLVPDAERYPDRPRDLRMACGCLEARLLAFPEAPEALRRCVRDCFSPAG